MIVDALSTNDIAGLEATLSSLSFWWNDHETRISTLEYNPGAGTPGQFVGYIGTGTSTTTDKGPVTVNRCKLIYSGRLQTDVSSSSSNWIDIYNASSTMTAGTILVWSNATVASPYNNDVYMRIVVAGGELTGTRQVRHVYGTTGTILDSFSIVGGASTSAGSVSVVVQYMGTSATATTINDQSSPTTQNAFVVIQNCF